ncbi:hypothetical protein CHS0354_019638 [Potamilus streckersoni]|uniref:Uncharacterized protein n=1 Tax=Potamilus streckersoni TaxID=2493646 RepID=A0AAE0T8Z4_9BIVA|nr:hypothetical protein CHS0354_019638 [Potamilus streckersoni]
MSDSDLEKTPLLLEKNGKVPTQETKIAVFKRRWYVLAVFSYANAIQGLIWNTWGPIAQTSEAVYKGWTDSTIGMMANWGNISYIIFTIPMCYFMDRKGLRVSLLLTSSLMLIGAGIRCITQEPPTATWLIYVGQTINGIAGIVPFGGPALVASVWFPPEQRATATAISSFWNYCGVALSFVIGPQLVDTPMYSDYNVTNTSERVAPSNFNLLDDPDPSSAINKDTLKPQVLHLLYIEFGAAGLLFLLTLIYFPSRPPLPPSITASIERTSYRKGLVNLMSNGPLWLIVLAYSIPTGVLGVWASVIDVNLNPIGISQLDAGWMGFYGTIFGCLAGLVVARFSDVFMKRMKMFLIILFLCATGSIFWFTVMCNQYISYSKVSLYASCIMSFVFVNGGIPLFYEISCEASYPVAEGVTGGFLTLLNNLFGIMFLFMLLIPGIGTTWMNWCLLGSSAIALPLLLIFPEKYRRTDIDITIIVPDPKNICVQRDKLEETSE